MRTMQCSCPSCKRELRFNVGAAARVELQCPSCSVRFSVKVRNPAKEEATEEFAPLLDEPLPPRNPTPQRARPPLQQPSVPLPEYRYAPPAPKRKKKKGNGLKWVLVSLASIGVVLIGSVVIYGVVTLVKRNADSPLLSFDSREKVLADLQSEMNRLEVVVKAIPAGDQSEASAKKIEEGHPPIFALVRRAFQLPTQRSQPNEPTAEAKGEIARPNIDQVWRVDLSCPPDHKVTAAINKITLEAIAIRSFLAIGLLELPDPLTHKDPAEQWTEEERRLLAVIHLQGQLKRDFVRKLAKVDPINPTPTSLQSLHELIDQHAKLAKNLTAITTKSQMMVKVPKRTQFEFQERGANSAFYHLHDWIVSQPNANQQLKFIVDDLRKVDEAIGEIMFGPQFNFPSSSHERYLAKIQLEEEKLAETARKEQLRLEEEKRRSERIAAQNKEFEEKTEKDRQDRMAKNQPSNGDPSRGPMLGPTPPRIPSGLGPSGPYGPGSPNGMPPGTAPSGFGPSGFGPPGSGQPGSAPPGFPQPGFPPPGFPPQGLPGQGFPGQGSPPTGPNFPQNDDPAKRVTIVIADAKTFDSNQVMALTDAELKKYPRSISQSNSMMTITIGNYDKPLDDLAKVLKFLTIDKIDQGTRTMTARVSE